MHPTKRKTAEKVVPDSDPETASRAFFARQSGIKIILQESREFYVTLAAERFAQL
jgi:hypothetical protein